MIDVVNHVRREAMQSALPAPAVIGPLDSGHDLQGDADGDQRGWIGTRWKTSVPSNLLTAEAAAGPRGAAVLVAPAGREPLGVVDSYVTSQGALTASLIRGRHVWALSIDEDVSVRES